MNGESKLFSYSNFIIIMSNIKIKNSNNYNNIICNEDFDNPQNPQIKNLDDQTTNRNEDFKHLASNNLNPKNSNNKKLEPMQQQSKNNYKYKCTYHERRRNFCNIGCKICHPDRPKLSAHEIKEIRDKRQENLKNGKRKTTFCCYKCNFCTRIIDLEFQRDMDQAIQACISEKTESKQDKNITVNQDEKIQQNPPNTPEELMKMIEKSQVSEFREKKVYGDGNCLPRALLEANDLPGSGHQEMREQIAKAIMEDTVIEWPIIIENEDFNREDLVGRTKKSGKYLGIIELSFLARKTKAWYAIRWSEEYSKDEKNKKWIIVKDDDYEYFPKAVTFLQLHNGSNDRLSHFNALAPPTYLIFPDKNLLSREMDNSDRPFVKHNFLFWNPRSIRDQTKKMLLHKMLTENEIAIAGLFETFTIPEDTMYLKGYRIYRADAENRRKGVMILINTKLQVKTSKLLCDPAGRYLKLRLTNTTNDAVTTISAVYLEPSAENEQSLIDDAVWTADIVFGDLNNAPTGLMRSGVYHHRGIENIQEITEAKSLSDHPAYRSQANIQAHLVNEERTQEVLVNKIAEHNTIMIKEACTNENWLNIELSLGNPRKTMKIKDNNNIPKEYQYVDDWKELKEHYKNKQKEAQTKKLKNADKLLTNNTQTQEAWLKINSALFRRPENKIWTPNSESELNEVVRGFTTLYEGKETSTASILTQQKTLKDLIDIGIAIYSQAEQPPPGLPYSRARDYNGFSQREIMGLIISGTMGDTLQAYNKLNLLMSNAKNLELFFHSNTRIILLKKLEEVVSWMDLRPISIMPANIIVLEKILLPILKEGIKKALNINQFAIKDESDVSIAKLQILYKHKQKNLKRLLLIDVKKAFDSIDREKLLSIAKDKLDETTYAIIEKMMTIYNMISLNIGSQQIHPKKGLLQGSSWSMPLFCLYINETLTQLNTHKDTHVQAFVDDIAIESQTKDEIQKAFTILQNTFTSLGLQINSSKCEYLSEDETEQITSDYDQIITATTIVKYLGQKIDINCEPTTIINHKFFGSLIHLLGSASSLTIKARIKIFQTYLRTKFNHLLPMMCLTKDVQLLWKTIRSIIFKNVLNSQTTPRETAALFGLSYYNVIIKPLVKLIERNHRVMNDSQQTQFLKEKSTEAFRFWCSAEPNLTLEMKQIINEVTSNERWYTYLELEEKVKKQATLRLFKDSPVPLQYINLINLKEPNLILMLSNANKHLIKQFILNHTTSNGEEKKKQLFQQIAKIYYEYLIILENLKELRQISINENDPDCEIDRLIECITLHEIKIELLIENHRIKIQAQANEVASESLTINTNNTKENYEEPKALTNLIDNFRNFMSEADKQTWRNTEIMLEILRQSKTEDKEPHKKPGRPKHKHEGERNQSTLEEFLSLK